MSLNKNDFITDLERRAMEHQEKRQFDALAILEKIKAEIEAEQKAKIAMGERGFGVLLVVGLMTILYLTRWW